MALIAGTRLGAYEILASLGVGGMGEVYRARDTKLERDVALKILPESFTHDPEHVARFRREAQLLAALNHPNIGSIYGLEESGGTRALVLELVEGETLADRLARGPVPPDEALQIATHVADALEAAHQRGILHRDLKPANIMITSSGTAKLLDFGVAKLTTSEADVTQTLERTVLGTVAYMSPEQAEGKSLDARSDIFSFGAVLYETLSGHRAFSGPTTVGVLNAVLRNDPPPLETTPVLQRIVRKCLAKPVTERFQTMKEVAAALGRSASEPIREQPSIAVLAFANMSADKENEYFSDGLAEEITNVLAHVPGLRVAGRTSAFYFRGKDVDLAEIGRRLNVEHVLEGSVRKAGHRIRVTAQLIKVNEGFHVWSERYERELADVFAVQDEIASAIAEALQGKLCVALTRPRGHTPNVAAYEAYLKARHYQWKLLPEAVAQGRKFYEEAIALDPQYAFAHIGLCEHFFIEGSTTRMRAREAMPLARAAAERALEIDPSTLEAHAWLGIVAATYDYDWQEAERRFRLATAREPVTPGLRHLRAYFYLRLVGRTSEAVAEHQRALQEDPLNLIIRVGLAASLITDGRDGEAWRETRAVLDLDPRFPAVYTLVTPTTETFDEALAFAETGYALSPWNSSSIGLLAGLLRRLGEDERVEHLLEQLGDRTADDAAIGFAVYHLVRSETDRAVDWIDKAIDQRHPFVVMTLVSGAFGRILRASPRWQALARRMHLPATV